MNLVVSVSGGETSAFMISVIKKSKEIKRKYSSVSYVFANTSQENEETLQFVKKLDDLFDIKIIWLESITNHGIRKTSDYNVVNFYTAHRNGEIFEDMILKYGIPNKSYPHCTRELKNEPIKQWCKDNFEKDYEIAIGIRLDEKERKPKNNVYQTVYPLLEEGYTKDDVISFWGKQKFRLGIEIIREIANGVGKNHI